MCVFSGPKDPIPLRHFGWREILAKINLMEDRFDLPMTFEENAGPTQSVCSWAGGQYLGQGHSHVWCSQRLQVTTTYTYADGQHVWF